MKKIIDEYKNELVVIYKAGLNLDWANYHYHCGRASGLLTAVLLTTDMLTDEYMELSSLYTKVLDAVAFRDKSFEL